MVFPVVMYGCESWTIIKAECWRLDAFELWCWRRLLRAPWTARRSNQSILKETSPGCSLERLMLKLKLQYFGHLMWRAESFEKTLMLRKIEGRRRRGRQRMRWLDGITDTLDMVWVVSGSWWWTGRPGVLWFMESQRVRHDWATELSTWWSVHRAPSGPFVLLMNWSRSLPYCSLPLKDHQVPSLLPLVLSYYCWRDVPPFPTALWSLLITAEGK